MPILAFCIVTLSLGAGLSVVRYRLYDVERVVTDSSAYALSTGAVIAAFGLVVLVITRTVPVGADSPLSTVLATLAAAGVARPAYVWARNAVDRRFNRRRFDAVRVVESGLADGTPDVEELLRDRARRPATRRWCSPPTGSWVTADGRVAEPGEHAVDIVRRGAVTARLRFDPARTDPGVVAAVAAAAAAEIDNLGLRAELARQVEQVTESRTRLATAHLDERRRMERDLHDGAQQRLLAIALQLQSARVNDDDTVVRDEIDRAVAQLGATVQDLRALASGLHAGRARRWWPAGRGRGAGRPDPAADPAGRQSTQRYPATLESAAWFVIAEGVANAVKHAQVDEVAISAHQVGEHLRVVRRRRRGRRRRSLAAAGCRASPTGSPRSAGRCRSGPAPRGGTTLEAVFPCGL